MIHKDSDIDYGLHKRAISCSTTGKLPKKGKSNKAQHDSSSNQVYFLLPICMYITNFGPAFLLLATSSWFGGYDNHTSPWSRPPCVWRRRVFGSVNVSISKIWIRDKRIWTVYSIHILCILELCIFICIHMFCTWIFWDTFIRSDLKNRSGKLE